MKKTFEIAHPKVVPARRYEAVKHEINKYLKRERRKPLPEGVGFWDFDCRFGTTEANAESVHAAEINKKVDEAEKEGLMSFYVEILVKPGKKK